MGRPRLQEGDARYEERRNKAMVRIVRLLKEIDAAEELLTALKRDLREQMEMAG